MMVAYGLQKGVEGMADRENTSIWKVRAGGNGKSNAPGIVARALQNGDFGVTNTGRYDVAGLLFLDHTATDNKDSDVLPTLP